MEKTTSSPPCPAPNTQKEDKKTPLAFYNILDSKPMPAHKRGNLTALARMLAAGQADCSKYNNLKSIHHASPSLTIYLSPVTILICCVGHSL